MDEFNAVADALTELAHLTSAVEQQVKELKDSAAEYADACAHARKTGDKVPSYSGSAQQKQVAALVQRLTSAAQSVGFTGGELQRFGS